MQKVTGATFSVAQELSYSDQGRGSPDKLKNDFPNSRISDSDSDDDMSSPNGKNDVGRMTPVPFRPEEIEIEKKAVNIRSPLQQLIAQCFEIEGFEGDVDGAIALAKEKMSSSSINAISFFVQLQDAINKKTIASLKPNLFDFFTIDQLINAAEFASIEEYLEVSHFLYKKVTIKDKDNGYTVKHGWAFYKLAEQYEKGIGTKVSPELARAVCQRAVEMQYLPAIYRLAQYVEFGIGCAKNFRLALAQYHIGAAGGDGQSLLRLAKHYREEIEESTENNEQAHLYLERAVEAGLALPPFEEGLIAYSKSETRESGFQQIKKAACDGSYSAQLWLAKFGSESASLNPRPYFNASLGRHPTALFRHLGTINYEGKVVEQNLDLAIAFFAKAVECTDHSEKDWENLFKAKIAKEKETKSSMQLVEQTNSAEGLVVLSLLCKDGFKDDVQTIAVNWEMALQAWECAKITDFDYCTRRHNYTGLSADMQEIGKKWDGLTRQCIQFEEAQKSMQKVKDTLSQLVAMAPLEDLVNKDKNLGEFNSAYKELAAELLGLNSNDADLQPIYANKSTALKDIFNETLKKFEIQSKQRCEPTKKYLENLKNLTEPISIDGMKNQQGLEELVIKNAAILIAKAQGRDKVFQKLESLVSDLIKMMGAQGKLIIAEFKKEKADLQLRKGKVKQFEAKKTQVSEMLHRKESHLEAVQDKIDAILEKIDLEMVSISIDPNSQNIDQEVQDAIKKMDAIQVRFLKEKKALLERQEKIEEMEAKRNAVYENLRKKQEGIVLELKESQEGNQACLRELDLEFSSLVINQDHADLDCEERRITEKLKEIEQKYDAALNAFSISSQQEESKGVRSKERSEVQSLQAKNLELERRLKEMESKLHQAERITVQATQRGARQTEELKKAHAADLERQRQTADFLRKENENLRSIVQAIPITTSIEILQASINRRISDLRVQGIKAYREYNLNNFPPRIFNLDGLETILLGIGFQKSGETNGSHNHYERGAESMGLSPHNSEEADKAQIQQVLNFLLSDLNKIS